MDGQNGQKPAQQDGHIDYNVSNWGVAWTSTTSND